MPHRDEANFITRSLEAVLAQDYPADRMEIIMADGMSIDGTKDIIYRLQTQYPNLRLVDNPPRIVPIVFNAVLSVTRGDISKALHSKNSEVLN